MKFARTLSPGSNFTGSYKKVSVNYDDNENDYENRSHLKYIKHNE